MSGEVEAKEKVSVTIPPELVDRVTIRAKQKYPQKRGGGNKSAVVEDALWLYFMVLDSQKLPNVWIDGRAVEVMCRG